MTIFWTKWIRWIFLKQLSDLKPDFILTLSYLNPALNNLALDTILLPALTNFFLPNKKKPFMIKSLTDTSHYLKKLLQEGVVFSQNLKIKWSQWRRFCQNVSFWLSLENLGISMKDLLLFILLRAWNTGKFWVPMRKLTADVWIVCSNALPLSQRPLQGSYIYVTHVLYTSRISKVKSLVWFNRIRRMANFKLGNIVKKDMFLSEH